MYRGPEMDPPKPANPFTQRSAAWCERCHQRRVQTLMVLVPTMDPDTMRADEMMAAAFCGPDFRWACPCGELMLAPGLEATGW